MSDPNTLDQALQAIQNGDTQAGRQLLAQVLRADPKNAQAWLWMSDVVDSDDKKADCLRRVLALDPTAQEAQEAQAELARIESAPNRRDELTYPSLTAPVLPEQMAPQSSTPTALSSTNQPHFTIRNREVESAGSLTPTQRQRGYRNTFIAGAMMLLLLGGLVLLVYTVTSVVPQAQERLRPTLEAELYEATLWCPPCQQAGSQIVLWEKVGDGTTRGGKTGELPHDTPVSVLAEEWSAPEERTYYKVTALGQKGWVPDTFLKESLSPQFSPTPIAE